MGEEVLVNHVIGEVWNDDVTTVVSAIDDRTLVVEQVGHGHLVRDLDADDRREVGETAVSLQVVAAVRGSSFGHPTSKRIRHRRDNRCDLDRIAEPRSRLGDGGREEMGIYATRRRLVKTAPAENPYEMRVVSMVSSLSRQWSILSKSGEVDVPLLPEDEPVEPGRQKEPRVDGSDDGQADRA